MYDMTHNWSYADFSYRTYKTHNKSAIQIALLDIKRLQKVFSVFWHVQLFQNKCGKEQLYNYHVKHFLALKCIQCNCLGHQFFPGEFLISKG